MDSPLRPSEAHRQTLAVAGIILAVALYRILSAVLLPGLPNFAPVSAMAFCGGLFLTGPAAWIIPLAALAVSDLGLAALLGYPLFGLWQVASWACLVAAVAFGRWIARREHLGPAAFFASLVGTGVFFYLVTNTVSWLLLPEYPRSLAGLTQALWSGLPGYPPTWVFFRNSLASDLFFGALILAARALAVAGLPAPLRSESSENFR